MDWNGETVVGIITIVLTMIGCGFFLGLQLASVRVELEHLKRQWEMIGNKLAVLNCVAHDASLGELGRRIDAHDRRLGRLEQHASPGPYMQSEDP